MNKSLTIFQSLEQLTNSQTFGGTIVTTIILRAYGIYTLCLILLWVFNPLGSQASLSGVYLMDRYENGVRNLSIADASGVSRVDLQFGLDPNAAANMVYTTAFASIESSTQYVDTSSDGFQREVVRLGGTKSLSQSTVMDPWGNVRMPKLKSLKGYDIKSPEEWINVPLDELANYTSLVGVPVSGIPLSSTENLTFSLNTQVETFVVSDRIDTKRALN